MDTIARWFSSSKVDGMTLHGLGVMCGKVSGGLYCRDFDDAAAFEAWKMAHSALTGTLPTVRTRRGFHVYATADEQVKTKKFTNGELRGEKAFVVLPPSKHPSGAVYEWIVPLPSGELPIISPSEAGFIPAGHVTERQRSTEKTEKQNGHLSLRVSVSLSHKIEEAIALTLPTKTGVRNNRVFTFARALKAITELKDLDAAVHRDIVKQWHDRAKPVIGTQGFDETWADFCHAWPRVAYPLGTSPLESIMEILTGKCPPPETARYETPGIKKLVALCAELQRRAGNNVFFLDCRTAGQCVGVDHNTANRWLNMLTTDKLLLKMEQGKPGHATRWRWCGV